MRAILEALLISSLSAILMSTVSSHAADKNDSILYEPLPNWVAPTPAFSESENTAGGLLQFRFSDTQVRLGTEGAEIFSAYRIKILQPEALEAGKIVVQWKPTTGWAKVHKVNLIRDGQTIDILKSTKFTEISNEQQIEQSMLHGLKIALLQIPGLIVGDEIEVMLTVMDNDPTVGNTPSAFGFLPQIEAMGIHRVSIDWPQSLPVRWQVTPDLGRPQEQSIDGRTKVEISLTDPKSVISPDGAPARYSVHRMLEATSFSGWPQLSSKFRELYDFSAKIDRGSALDAEVEKLVNSNASTLEKANAALRLVQDKTRYVYVGLGDGNFVPANAEETWERRFADCKGKTALLLGILNRLGIEAEPVLVNLAGLDGADKRLPTPAVFNHVLVRANIEGNSYWLDGTLMNQPLLQYFAAPKYGWVLPLRANGGQLENYVPPQMKEPEFLDILEIDARAGLQTPAMHSAKHIFRGQSAVEMQNGLARFSTQDSKRQLTRYWQSVISEVTPENVDWSFDRDRAILVLTMQGKGKVDTESDGAYGANLFLERAGFSPPAEMRRPADQPQDAPWAISYPSFRCWLTNIKLPLFSGSYWTFISAPIDKEVAGTKYFRRVAIKNDTFQSVLSKRNLVPEIGSSEAKDTLNIGDRFNNKKASLAQVTGKKPNDVDEPASLLDFDALDKASVGTTCTRSEWQQR